jgi:uncharacterized Zn-binding protein involved in type VI secretion
MPGASRLGDTNGVSGKIEKGASTVFINGIPAGLHVSTISPHVNYKGPHKVATTTSASDTVIVEGSPLLKIGSSTTCGHSIVDGSSDVFCP